MPITIQDALRPMVLDVRSLIELRRELTLPNPTADSEAMSERTHDARLADAWGRQPVTDAQNYARLLTHACEDHIWVLGQAVTVEDYFPVWGMLPPARAALEAAGRAADVAEPGIGARARVERFMNEDLFALAQVSDLPAGAKDTDEIRQRRQLTLESAARKGFTRTPHPNPSKATHGALATPAQLGHGRPSDTEVVRHLFDSDPDLGKVTYQWYSAGSHATAWEIFKPMTVEDVSASTGHTTALLAREPREAHLVLAGVLLGYLEAANRLLRLHGWANETWGNAAINSIRLQRQVGDRIDRASSPAA